MQKMASQFYSPLAIASYISLQSSIASTHDQRFVDMLDTSQSYIAIATFYEVKQIIRQTN